MDKLTICYAKNLVFQRAHYCRYWCQSNIYNIQIFTKLVYPQTFLSISTINYALKYLKYLAPKIWNILAHAESRLSEFISKVKSEATDGYPCILRHTYIVGQIN